MFLNAEAEQQHSHYISFVFSFMPSINFEHHTQFFTSTIFQWKHLLKDDVYKQIIIDSLLFLKKEGSIAVNAFVIMPNHFHLIWQIQDGYKADKIQLRFQKYTAQQMKFKLIDTNNKMPPALVRVPTNQITKPPVLS